MHNSIRIGIVLPILVACLGTGSLARQASAADEQETIRAIESLIREGKLDEAEQKYEEGLQTYPNSLFMRNLSRNFYSGFARAGEYQKAADYYFEMAMLAVDSPQTTPSTFGGFATTLFAIYNRTDTPLVANEKVEALIKAVAANEIGRDTDKVALVLAKLKSGFAVGLARAGKLSEANQLQKSNLEDAQQRYAAAKDEPTSILILEAWLKSAIDIAAADQDEEKRAEAASFHADFVNAQAKRFPTVGPLIQVYAETTTSEIGKLLYEDPSRAKIMLGKAVAFLDDIEAEDRRVESIINSSKARFKTLERRVESAIKRDSLIGQRRPPLEVQSFVNGDSLTDEDLDGKVVLLDFWAVWCGPCIATFPHLRRWHDEYEEEGLIVLGVTRYYSYDWDQDYEGIVRVEDLSQEDERAAMEMFARNYQLEHTLAVSDDGAIHNQYLVSGIPQAVLIDRQGIIRMIRVGSGKANTEALDKLIKELIAEGQ